MLPLSLSTHTPRNPVDPNDHVETNIRLTISSNVYLTSVPDISASGGIVPLARTRTDKEGTGAVITRMR